MDLELVSTPHPILPPASVELGERCTVRVTEGYLHLVPQDLRQLVEDPEQEALKELVGA
ncbi:MAG: hypothetical protein MK486_17980 [Gemmatimonadetes bacterium]|nr:hypothetical protein [Gemmatimonadota bacterium]